MKDRGNTGIIALILAALVGINYMPRGTKENQAEPGQPVVVQGERSSSSSVPDPSQPCQSIGSRLEPFYSDTPFTYPDSCYQSGKQEQAPSAAQAQQPNLRPVIALLPNPLQTHLPLTFDRAIESIVQAAQDGGYLYDSSWLPWSDEQRNYDRLDDDIAYLKRKHLIEEQPGVLVFRRKPPATTPPESRATPNAKDDIAAARQTSSVSKGTGSYKDGLVVFVVGEQPTHGVNHVQFVAAAEWVTRLPSDTRGTLRILGPYSSGTLSSLAHELEDLDRQKWLTGYNQIQIFSGSASSAPSIDQFRAELDQYVASKQQETHWQFDLRLYSESDVVKTDRLCQYLTRAGYDLGRMAFLSEDQTAFGGAKDQDSACQQKSDKHAGEDTPHSPVYLYFPRDIGALRAAYEHQSVFVAGKQPANTPSTSLRGELIEPSGSKFDAPRTYGGQLDVLAMESLLQAITVQLQIHRVQFVVIRSTNSLDRVFLSQFLSRVYPEARIVLDGSDLLFLRGGAGMSPRGILAVSTYPLLPGQQRWSRTLHAKHNNSYRAFGQDDIEGIYLAMRGLLAPNNKDLADEADVPVYDSLPPLWAPVNEQGCNPSKFPDCARPTTWITVIGHGRFWPIAALSEATGMNTRRPSMLTPADMHELNTGDAPDADDVNAGVHLLFPREMWVLLVLCALMGIWQLYCGWCGSIRGRFQALTYFAPQPRREYKQLVFLSSLLIGTIGAVLAVLSGLISGSELPRWLSVWMWLATSWLVLCAALSLLGNLSLPRLHCDPTRCEPADNKGLWKTLRSRITKHSDAVRSDVGILVLLILAYAVFLEVYLVSGLTPANRFPTFWRAVNLFSFVSPLFPQILLLFALRGWLWCNLQGMSLMGYDRPRLPRESQMPLLRHEFPPNGSGKSIMRFMARKRAQTPVEDEAMPLGIHWLKLFPICFIGAAFVFRFALRDSSVRSLGEKHFGNLVFWWLVLMAALLLTDTIQLARTWNMLRRLLVLLDRLPLRRTLAAMKGIAWGSIWKMGGNVTDERYRVISRQIESLTHLKNEIANVSKETSGDATATTVPKEVLDRIASCQRPILEFGNWYVSLSEKHKRCLSTPVSDIGPVSRFQEALAKTAGAVLTDVLVPEWQKESDSLLIDKKQLQAQEAVKSNIHRPFAPSASLPDLVRAAEEFFVLPYLGFIQNMIARIRSMAIGMLALFLGMTLAVASYPFDPQQTLGRLFVGLFLISGFTVAYVYASMLRDATLSYVTDTNPGELGWQFWFRLLTFGIGPLIALLTTLFPSLTDLLLSWSQPGGAHGLE